MMCQDSRWVWRRCTTAVWTRIASSRLLDTEFRDALVILCVDEWIDTSTMLNKLKQKRNVSVAFIIFQINSLK